MQPDTLPKTDTIEIVANGEALRVPAGSTLAGLLARLELDPARVAIEFDRRIVRRPEWPSTVLAAGSQVEIVQFVGGG
jgi:thiamine biosynthesis protein ThiS